MCYLYESIADVNCHSWVPIEPHQLGSIHCLGKEAFLKALNEFNRAIHPPTMSR